MQEERLSKEGVINQVGWHLSRRRLPILASGEVGEGEDLTTSITAFTKPIAIKSFKPTFGSYRRKHYFRFESSRVIKCNSLSLHLGVVGINSLRRSNCVYKDRSFFLHSSKIVDQ